MYSLPTCLEWAGKLPQVLISQSLPAKRKDGSEGEEISPIHWWGEKRKEREMKNEREMGRICCPPAPWVLLLDRLCDGENAMFGFSNT